MDFLVALVILSSGVFFILTGVFCLCEMHQKKGGQE